MSYKNISFIIFFVIQTVLVFGQNSPTYTLDSTSGKLIADIRAHEKEQAYLVTDKAVYMPGENIWIKVFLLNSTSQKISSRSKYLFVDMVNEKDSVIKIIILDAANKQLNSRMTLPASLTGGDYWLRAYTKTMAEGDTGSIAVTSIYIAGKDAVGNHVQKKKQKRNGYYTRNKFLSRRRIDDDRCQFNSGCGGFIQRNSFRDQRSNTR